MPVFSNSQISIYNPAKTSLYLSKNRQEANRSQGGSRQLSRRSLVIVQSNFKKKLTSLKKIKKLKKRVIIESLGNLQKTGDKASQSVLNKKLKLKKKSFQNSRDTFSVLKKFASVKIEKNQRKNKASIDLSKTGFDFKSSFDRKLLSTEFDERDEEMFSFEQKDLPNENVAKNSNQN